MSRLAALLALAGILGLTPTSRADQEWGTIKGQVVWADDKLPEPEKIEPTTDKAACTKRGDLVSEKYVIDPKTRGVRWVVVWLLDPSGDKEKAIPTHPSLAEVPEKEKKVTLDQPCCMFEPHVLCLREGQTLIAKNTSPVSHNVNITSVGWNELIAAGAEKECPALGITSVPVIVQCNIHPWMGARIAVFKNPYFAVTDENGRFEIKNAPAGKYLLVVWHEQGFVNKLHLSHGMVKGDPIEIKPDGVTEVKFEMKKTGD